MSEKVLIFQIKVGLLNTMGIKRLLKYIKITYLISEDRKFIYFEEEGFHEKSKYFVNCVSLFAFCFLFCRKGTYAR